MQSPAQDLEVRGTSTFVEVATWTPDADFHWYFSVPAGIVPGTTYTTSEQWTGASDHIGMSVTGNGRGCSLTRQQFTVASIGYDASGAVNALDVFYSQDCSTNTSPPAPMTGELRLGLPARSVGPNRVAFLPTDPQTSSPPTPVFVMNPSPNPQSVGTPTISAGGGTSSGEFLLASNGCPATLAANASCTLTTRFAPTTAGPKTATLSVPVGGAAQAVALQGTSNGGVTDIRYSDDHLNQSYSYTPQNAQITARGDAHGTVIGFVNDKYRDDITFNPGAHRTLVAGQSYRFTPTTQIDPDMPSLGQFGGCGYNTADGSFTIKEITLDASGATATLAATLWVYCNGDPPVRGAVAYRASEDPSVPTSSEIGPRPDPVYPPYVPTPGPPTPSPTPGQPGSGGGKGGPPPLASATATGSDGRVSLSWAAPSDSDVVGTLVRSAPGSTPPASADAGKDEGTFSGTTAEVPAPSGTDFAFSLFAVDRTGNTSPATHVVAHGTRLAVPTPRAVGVNGSRLIGGSLSSAGKGLANAPVQVYRRTAGEKTWTLLATVRTDATGNVRYTATAAKTTDYDFRFHGDSAGRTGSETTARLVVLPTVTMTRVGTAWRVRTTPAIAGATVSLQKLVGSTWRTVATRRTSAKGETAFGAGPGTFRAVLAASGAYGSAVSKTCRG